MNNKPSPSKELIEKITKVYPTPFHLYSEQELGRRARLLNRAFSWNDGFKEYYAVKACPTPGVIDVLRREGCGVDCASYCELKLADAMGFRGEQIMFSSNETPAGEFAYAKKLGAIINLDDFTMVDAVQNECGMPEKVCLRYNPGGEIHLGNSVMGNPGESKFGMTREQIFEAAEKCLHLGAKEIALHAFLVSNTTDESYYPTNASVLMQLALDLNRQLGCRIFMINLSGGVGIPYRPEENEADIEQIGFLVKQKYQELLEKNGMCHVKMASELGRYMSASAGWLITQAIHEKNIYRHYIGVDACAADLMRPAMYGAYHHITVAGKEDAPETEMYDVVGSLCENNDKFAVNRLLPKVDIGDYLVIHDTGAHGRSMGYNYNGRLRCAEIMLRQDGSFELIRRAETPNDYFATLDVCKNIPLFD